ncbi:hypothetical protein [Falsiruegeria mediterranea]
MDVTPDNLRQAVLVALQPLVDLIGADVSVDVTDGLFLHVCIDGVAFEGRCVRTPDELRATLDRWYPYLVERLRLRRVPPHIAAQLLSGRHRRPYPVIHV